MGTVDDRLGLKVRRPDGHSVTWGPGEPETDRILQGLNFSTRMPGGDGDLGDELFRRIDLDYPDLGFFDEVEVFGPGAEKVWGGRHEQFPRDHGDAFAIRPGAIGHAAALKDDETVREIYAHSDLTAWEGASSKRRRDFALAGYSVQDPSVVDDDSGEPAIQLGYTGKWDAVGLPVAVAQLNGKGIPLGPLYYRWERNANVSSGGDANFRWDAKLADDDTVAAYDITGDLQAAGPASGTLSPTTATRRVAEILHAYLAGPGGLDNVDYSVFFSALTQYGLHGITPVGDGTATEGPGLLMSDIVADAISRWAPELTFTTGPGGSIRTSDFPISHLAFFDPVTVEDVILACNVFHQWDWWVDPDKTFHMAPYDSSQPWQLRLDQGTAFSAEGVTGDDLVNGVAVFYTDFYGRDRIIGPPGIYGADLETALLLDPSPANPANAHGKRKWKALDIPFQTTADGAVALAIAWLFEHTFPQRRGSITATGTAWHPTKGELPVSRIRAGQPVKLTDFPGDIPRKVVETRYTHQDRSNNLSLDNGADRVDAAFERLGIRIRRFG